MGLTRDTWLIGKAWVAVGVMIEVTDLTGCNRAYRVSNFRTFSSIVKIAP